MSNASRPAVVLTCEHGGNRVPDCCQHLFADADDVLASHRGWDPGAWPLAQSFSKALSVPLAGSRFSRLVVELNRSLHHPKLFSEFTRDLPEEQRRALITKYWQPHRDQVGRTIARLIRQQGMVVHLSVHTFTEIFGDEIRRTDIGLLYDPRRSSEHSFCAAWVASLKTADASWNVRRNHPYRGSSDGFTTSLRKQFSPDEYLGIELEVCQKFFLQGGARWKTILHTLPKTFDEVLGSFQPGRNGKRQLS